MFEAMLGGFTQAFFAILNRPDFTAQAQFAEGNPIPRDGPFTITGHHRHDHCQIPGSFGQAQAANHVDEYVLVDHGHAPMPVQHRQQHRQAVAFHAHRDATRGGQMGFVHQGLHLDQQGAATLAHDHDHCSRHVFFIAG